MAVKKTELLTYTFPVLRSQLSVLSFNPASQAFPPSYLGKVCKHPLLSVCRRFRFQFSVFSFPFILCPLPTSSYFVTNRRTIYCAEQPNGYIFLPF